MGSHQVDSKMFSALSCEPHEWWKVTVGFASFDDQVHEWTSAQMIIKLKMFSEVGYKNGSKDLRHLFSLY